METKRKIAIDIALQTRVLRECSRHRRLYLVDADLAPAFEPAMQLLRQRSARVALFRLDRHKLTGLISNILGKAPAICPQCCAALRCRCPGRRVRRPRSTGRNSPKSARGLMVGAL